MSTKTPGKAKLKISTGSGASKQHTITIGKAHLDTDTSHKPKTTRSKSQCPVELNRHGSEVQAHQQDVSIALNDSSCSAVAQNTDMLPQINYNYDNSWIGSDIDIAMTDALNPHSDDQDHSSTDAESQERTEDKYWYALDKLQAVFWISNEEYVSQDWDAEQGYLKIGSYYHLTHQPTNIVLQLVQYCTIKHLRHIHMTGIGEDWFQSIFPTFGSIIMIHAQLKTNLPLAVCQVAHWLAERADTVYTKLAQHDAAPVNMQHHVQALLWPWYHSGTFYGLPAVRSHQIYTKLKDDGTAVDQDSEQIGDCNKFYKTYSKNNLTGGIMVLWCRHSICLGFHSIPRAEGHNNVFSAIYTRFPKAPQVIVYDFACQLAPYCLIHEAQYFRDTQFLIDEFHAHDHT
ncbi:hypothetical protein Moror_7119 [Moniliophthora roreri MCA 2997]|uniref:Uncharacterized protein n=1 Tax=Moniliophthora roreri (strain MCA 2997) TaxID=1381753 RepID=V2XAW7_MONRO|nr:hypothetical protein Moror_7119 [Moniliophthora roreri MCA 2997]